MLQQTFHWHSNQNNERRLGALEASLAATGIEVDEGLPLIAALLGLPLGDRYPPSTVPPDQQRRRLLATLVAWTIGFAKAQPLVLATEDLHWADPSTLELTQLLVEQGATAPLMLLYTARPEFRAQWSSRAPHHTQIMLNRLSARHVRMIVAQVASQKALSDETVAAVVDRTGGVPLFVEELTRAVFEGGDPKLTGREIPATLHDSLMARLDRLGAAKEVAQVGAVIGREFSYELLHAVHQVPESELQTELGELADADLLYVQGIAPNANYQFKHALIRDAAYEALLKSRRKELHLCVARTIDEQFATLKETHPEVLAHHWSEAGETERAITSWTRSGKLAEAHNAFEEAQASYRQALAQINLLPESEERDVRELEFGQSLVRMLFTTRGYADAETIAATERTAAMAEKSGNLRQLVNLIIARGISSIIGGHLTEGTALADRALDLAIREGSPSVRGRTYLLQTMAHFYSGDLSGAEAHFVEGLAYFEHPGFRRILGVAVAAFSYGSINAWMSGRPGLSDQRMAQMMAVANDENAYELAFAGRFAAEIQFWTGRYEEAEASAARALELSQKHQFTEMAATARCVLGAARAVLRGSADSVALIQQGLTELRKVGESGLNWSLLIAMAQESVGAAADALETIEQALPSRSFVVYVPEALRLRGRLRLKLGQTESAENDFREAMTLAQSMSAKSWELRATTSLARLIANEGRRAEGRTMLAEIYAWFTEGFDTPDLKDAKALLEELSG
jgi:tetratricopeptide (TPR) repeat protein